MSFATSFSLSLKNLFTKKGRTTLTSFAGSIGIIGIALILAVSQGTTAYIQSVQEDTLSSYPLTLQSSHMDMGQLFETFLHEADSAGPHELDAVYSMPVMYDMLNALNTTEARENDLGAFKHYLETAVTDPEHPLHQALTGVQYTYDLDLQIFTQSDDGKIYHSDSQELLQEMMTEYFGMDTSAMMNMSESYGMDPDKMMTFGGTSMQLWQEMLPGENGAPINPVIQKQYDLVYGSWPNSDNEVVLVLNKQNELDDMALYALGLKSKAEMDDIMQSAIDKTEIDTEMQSWSYEDICNREFKLVLNSDCYVQDSVSGNYLDLRETDTGKKYLYDNGIPLKVTGIIRPSEDSVSQMLTGAIAYTHGLTEYIIEESSASEAVKAQQDSPMKDIFTGLPFRESTGVLTDAQKQAEFENYVSALDDNKKAETYVRIMCIPSDEQTAEAVQNSVGSMTPEQMQDALKQALSQQMNVDQKQVEDYISSMSDEDMTEMFSALAAEQFRSEYAAAVIQKMAATPPAMLAASLDQAMQDFTEADYAKYYEEALEFSDSSYEENLRLLGCLDLENPDTINLFAATFDSKDTIEAAIADYNDGVDDLSKITYTDYVGIMMSSITTVINAITYVLIAFVAVSLIVSSIMIGVITLISVQERTKEIGILRSIGASKRNVSSMFNAETVIIGFTSGTLGVLITYLLCIPINLILHRLTDIPNLSAVLPVPAAIALVLISMALTLISGIIPSRSAAKKDPVEALRSE